MTKFEILNDLYLIGIDRFTFGLDLIVNGIVYKYDKHSTGRHINIYLEDGEDKLHVYYDTEWFSSVYEFNETGRKHGYLIDDVPWNKIIEDQFKDWEIKIITYNSKKVADKLCENLIEQNKQKDLINKFKLKYTENAGYY